MERAPTSATGSSLIGTSIDLRESFAGRVGSDGVAAARAGGPLEAFELLTATPDGWPHVAWLSPGEMLLVDASTCRWCLWPDSTTVANLRASGRALLQAVIGPRVVKVRFSARPLGNIEVAGMSLAAFEATVIDGSEDSAPYAEVTSGLRYELKDPEAVADRWEAQLDALRELSTNDQE